MMHVYLDMWLQHLQNENSHECQVGCWDSPPVWSQSHYTSADPEEWLQFPGQSRLWTGQLHLKRWTHWVRENSYSETYDVISFKTANTKSGVNNAGLITSLYFNQPIPVDTNPSCLHATLASEVLQESSHTVPHALLLQISTRPS